MIRGASQECFSMSIIERRRMFSIGLYCAMTILTPSAGVQPATARALIGAAAPAFTLTDSNGRNLSLADFKGKTVVLEWTSQHGQRESGRCSADERPGGCRLHAHAQGEDCHRAIKADGKHPASLDDAHGKALLACTPDHSFCGPSARVKR